MSIHRECNCNNHNSKKCDCHKQDRDKHDCHNHDCHKHDCHKHDCHKHDCNKCDNCDHHNHCDCCDNRECCDKRFRIRLGGLKSGLAFRLDQLSGCNIKLFIEGETKPVEGKLILVGTDFAELLLKNKVDKKNKFDQFLIVPFESIKLIES